MLFNPLFVAEVPPAEVQARCTWVCLCGFLLLLVSTAARVERWLRQGGGGGLTPQQPGRHPPVCLTASTCNWKGSFPLGSADVRAGEGPSGGPRVSTWHLTLPPWRWQRWSRSFPRDPLEEGESRLSTTSPPYPPSFCLIAAKPGCRLSSPWESWPEARVKASGP